MQNAQSLMRNVSSFFGNKDNQRKMAYVAGTVVAIGTGLMLYNKVSEPSQEGSART